MPSEPSPNAASAPIEIDEDGYNSADDEDFNPDAADAAEGNESEAGDNDKAHEGAVPTSKSSKRKRTQAGPTDDNDHDDGEDLDFANSGDEATIRKGKRRGRKAGANGRSVPADQDDDEGGEGGLIKTRAQRAREQKDKRPLATATNSTVDVDALWASMSSAPVAEPTQPSAQPASEAPQNDQTPHGEHGTDAAPENPTTPLIEDSITIKRSFVFAGETITEEKVVARSSAEARLYLASQPAPVPAPSPSDPASTGPRPLPPLRRPKKRASLFDPAASAPKPSSPASAKAKPKLNTIEKSRVDWAGFVDKEGISDELDEHSRAKDRYLGRMDFLGRVEANREAEARKARGL